MKIAIVGIGNPILSDDAVGLIAAERLYELIPKSLGSVLIRHSEDMMSLIDELTNYDFAFIIDSFRDFEHVGEVFEVRLDEEKLSRFVSPHTLSFANTLSLYKASNIKLPKIVICGIAVKDADTFKEGLSEEVQNKLPETISSLENFFEQRLNELRVTKK